jgi:hypothetical protein
LRTGGKHSPENGEAAATALGRAANRCHGLYGFVRAHHTHGDGVLEAIQHLIGSVLEAGVGLVKLASRFGGELAELVAVVYVCEGSKNEI